MNTDDGTGNGGAGNGGAGNGGTGNGGTGNGAVSGGAGGNSPRPGTAVQRRASGEPATRPRADITADVTPSERAPAGGRPVLFTTVRERAGRAGRAVTGPRVRAVLRWLLRNGLLYPLTGVWVLARRGWEARTNARYERQMRTAEAAGDDDRLTEWEARSERARELRHRRRMDWVTAPVAFARTAAVLLGWLVAGLLGLGAVLAVGHSDLSWVLAPLDTAVQAVVWMVWLADAVWRPVLIGLVVAAAVGVWETGRRSGTVPGWAQPAHTRVDAGIVITPGGIAAALAHLGIPALSRAVKDGWQVEFSTPPVRVNRCGYQAVFSLPMGVTPEMIADKRDVLARNLVRAPLEVWPAAADHAGWVDLWVADPGSAERPAPPYPLLVDGRADVFAGVPVGVSQRGEVITLALPGANLVYGGLMGQGKSNAARVTLLGAALDPLCVVWVFVFANNGDFDAYRPRLARYHRGVDDPIAAAALDGLRELYADVARREARLAELGAKKVTRPLAERHLELRPTVALFSECHELFAHPVYGAEAADLAVQAMRRGRKTGITLAFDTQSSRADAIPPRIVELVKINACFAVKSWRSNDGFLGDGSFHDGIRATELRPGKDVGTSIVTGATPERFEIVKWFYLDVDDDTGYDAAAQVIERAMQNLPDPPRWSGEVAIIPAGESRDLLDDLDTVLGTERVNVADVPALLRELAPHWTPYRKLTGVTLRRILAEEHDIAVPRAHNTWPLDPNDVRGRITERVERADRSEES